MSIVITVLDGRVNTMFMMGDLRRRVSDKRTNELLFIRDDTQKVLKLNNCLFLGITGDLNTGLDLHKRLLSVDKLIPSSLIQTCKIWVEANSEQRCDFVLSGKYDDGSIFYFYRNPEGNDFITEFLGQNIKYVILTHKLFLNSVFEEFVSQNIPMEQAMKSTILYASRNDESISSQFSLSLVSSGDGE